MTHSLPPNAGLRRTLTTPRLTLEPTGPHHLEGIWDAMQTSLPELSPWMPWAVKPERADTRTFLERAEKSWSEGSGGDWVFTLIAEGVPLGTIGLGRADEFFLRAELGYWLRSDHAGRGLMSEAGSALIAFAFEDIGLHRLELHAAPGNRASIRVAEKLGFRHEGLIRDGGYVADWQDVLVFGLLETDPRPTCHI